MVSDQPRKVFGLILLSLLVYLAGWFYVDHATDGFSLKHIQLDHPPASFPKVALPPPNIFSNFYTYLSKGSQSYVFQSPDEKMVLKCFKFKHLRGNSLSKQKRVATVFASHQLAFSLIPKESGLIYIHLAPRDDFNVHTRLTDKWKREFLIALNDYFFVLQEKGKSLEEVISPFILDDQWQEIEQRLTKVFQLVIQEWNKGVFDKDHHIMRNMGFQGERALHLDVGMIERIGREEQSVHLEKYRLNMEQWIQENYPQKKMQWEKALFSSISAAKSSMR